MKQANKLNDWIWEIKIKENTKKKKDIYKKKKYIEKWKNYLPHNYHTSGFAIEFIFFHQHKRFCWISGGGREGPCECMIVDSSADSCIFLLQSFKN